MTLSVQLFALARDLAGGSPLVIPWTAGRTVADLRQALVIAAPNLTLILPACVLAVNSTYATDATVIPEGAEVACIPPVSGG